jgi:hypothetical protein
MTTCYQASFVPSVMLYVIHHITTDFLVPKGRCTIGSSVNKCIIFQHCLISVASASFHKSFPFFLLRSFACQCVQGTRYPNFQNGSCLYVLVLAWSINCSTLGNHLQYIGTVYILLCQEDHAVWHTQHK